MTDQATTAVAPRRKQATDFTDRFIEPFSQLRSEMDRLFNSFPFGLPSIRPAGIDAPALEMSETDKAYKITAELPGLDLADVEVTFEDGLLRIAGEKKEEREENERGYRLSERSYGSFERIVSIPAGADCDHIAASFRNGVLTVSVPKDGDAARQPRKIAIDKA